MEKVETFSSRCLNDKLQKPYWSCFVR